MGRTCKNCFMPLGETQIECSNCGTQNPVSEEIVSTDGQKLTYAPSPEDYPMKWFKFLIYFSLFAGCVLNLLNGIMALSGANYGKDAAAIYNAVPGLQSAETFYGIALIALAVYVLITRFVLAGYHKAGPAMYLGYLAATIAVVFIYSVMLSGIDPTIVRIDTGLWSYVEYEYSFSWSQTIGNIIANIIMLICNIIYFNKRKELFVY